MYLGWGIDSWLNDRRPAPALACERHEIELVGVRTRFLAAGAGPAVLLLHGLGDSAMDWQWLMPALSDRYRLYAPDLPGTTELKGAGADYSAENVAGIASSFLSMLDVPKAIVVGNSLGGLVAMHMALRQPSKVAALVLVDSAGLGKAINPILRMLALPQISFPAILWARTSPGALQRAFVRSTLMFARPYRVPGEWLREQYRLARLPSFLKTTERILQVHMDWIGQRQVMLDHLSNIGIPVLVTWGQQDLIVPIAHGRDAAERLPYGRFEVIPDSGHLPHIEQAERFAALMRTFLADRVDGAGEAGARNEKGYDSDVSRNSL